MKIASFKENPKAQVISEYTTEREPGILTDFVVLQFGEYQLEFPANLFNITEEND